MQNQNLIKQEFASVKMTKNVYFFSLDIFLYFGAVLGIFLLAYETRSFWSPALAVSAILTVGFISLIFVRQMSALKGKMELVNKISAEKSELRFNNLIKDSSDVSAIFSGDGITIFLSPSIRNILGYSPRAAIGMQSFDFIHPDD